MINKVFLVGHLGKNPRIFQTKSGQGCEFSVATSETWKNNSGEWQEHTEWHNVVCYRGVDNHAKYLYKGSQVHIEGKLKTTKYEKDGVTRYSTKIEAYRVTYLNKGDMREEIKKLPEFEPSDSPITEDDVPF